nr:proline dehydrogenase family protein [Hankyongella ginsenosidimutans]
MWWTGRRRWRAGPGGAWWCGWSRAYWDTEIKRAQELGLPDYPVFTRKVSTDLSYIACAKKMLANRDALHCAFATHNAHTLAAILALAGQDRSHMEFQRLHGMGDLLYAEAQRQIAGMPPVRVYAPVGAHRDLLAYLVRRLLENGANSSFVNRFMDLDTPPASLARDPCTVVRQLGGFATRTSPAQGPVR